MYRVVVTATTLKKAPEADCSPPIPKKHVSSASVLVSMLQKGLEQQHSHLPGSHVESKIN